MAPAMLALAFSTLSGCGSSARSSVTPEPSLAGSREAQRAFHRIEVRFVDAPPEARAKLEPELREFLSRFGEDDRARIVRLYLAWIELDRRRPAAAMALARSVREGPPGAPRDFADVVHAGALRREGKVVQALALLLPLRGKISDPDQRGLHADELVRALVDARRFDDAIAAMLDWAEQASASDREDVVAAIEALVRAMPAPALEAGQKALDAEERREAGRAKSTRAEARRWLLDTVRVRLVRMALTERDPELARRLLESSPPGLRRDETRAALVALAATSSVAASVAGRAVGVVLDVTDDVSRRRSAEVVLGMTRALGLPAAADREDAVRLVTRDASEPGDVERALSGLAGEGATVLVAGVTDEAAVAASLFAERTQTPVIVLRRPAVLAARTSFTFALGTDAPAEEAAVTEALAAAGLRVAGRVGPGGTPCDAVAATPGGPRFPVREWKRASIDVLVLTGDAACARDAALEAMGGGLSPTLLLGLESVEAADALAGRKLVVGAGRFPFGTALADDERAWVSEWGTAPSWYAALGHDAAALAVAVLAGFPLERADHTTAVARLHRQARDGLARARARLWSTAAPGFEGGNVIRRELRAVVLERLSP